MTRQEKVVVALSCAMVLLGTAIVLAVAVLIHSHHSLILLACIGLLLIFVGVLLCCLHGIQTFQDLRDLLPGQADPVYMPPDLCLGSFDWQMHDLPQEHEDFSRWQEMRT